MCGIAGVWGLENAGEITRRMITAQRHRGPDDSGCYEDRRKTLALGNARLSIIDLEGGHQPLASADGNYIIVYNGEIYNSPELRRQLEQGGKYTFKTDHSDTETLLYYFIEHGIEGLRNLNGMFAAVIYDLKRQKLIGCRDRFGIKPLYYYRQGTCFAFSSELKAFFQVPGFTPDIDHRSLYHYLNLRAVHGADSIVSSVKRLLPGHGFTLDLNTGEMSVNRWWHITDVFRGQGGQSREEWQHLIRQELGAAVDRWMLSDVDIGLSLSGGFDSSILLGLMAQRSGSRRLNTFTLAVYDRANRATNETEQARASAEYWNTNHHEFVISAQEILDHIPKIVWCLDEPYAGGLPSYEVYNHMHQAGIKVALTGMGGDELFGNYFGPGRLFGNRPALYQLSLGLHQTPPLVKSTLGRLFSLIEHLPLNALMKPNYEERVRRMVRALRYDIAQLVHDYYYIADEQRRRLHLFQSGFVPREKTTDVIQESLERLPSADIRDQIMFSLFDVVLPDEYLPMTDRFSMDHSVEARTPFLDSQFVELVAGMPPEMRVAWGDPKQFLKDTFHDVLLPGIRKRGFTLPIDIWVREDLKSTIQRFLSPETLRKQGIFNPEFVQTLIREHAAGKSHAYRIWSLFMFQLWHYLYVEQRGKLDPAGVRLKDL